MQNILDKTVSPKSTNSSSNSLIFLLMVIPRTQNDIVTWGPIQFRLYILQSLEHNPIQRYTAQTFALGYQISTHTYRGNFFSKYRENSITWYSNNYSHTRGLRGVIQPPRYSPNISVELKQSRSCYSIPYMHTYYILRMRIRQS